MEGFSRMYVIARLVGEVFEGVGVIGFAVVVLFFFTDICTTCFSYVYFVGVLVVFLRCVFAPE